MLRIFFGHPSGGKDFLSYKLISNEFNDRWFRKLKKIHKVKPDPHDSDLSWEEDAREPIEEVYKKFCQVTGQNPEDLDFSKQETMNYLHGFYERNNNIVTDEVIYSFHRSIHQTENKISGRPSAPRPCLTVGWGVKEGLLVDRYNSQKQYTREDIRSGDIYLAWSELGKKPSDYFRDGEPSDQDRFNSLSKPNIHHRPKFFIPRDSSSYSPFNLGFTKWFNNYRKSWLNHYELEDWQPHDEQGGVHLAQVQEKDAKELLKRYPLFDSIEISQ